jgi:hypothetical protein
MRFSRLETWYYLAISTLGLRTYEQRALPNFARSLSDLFQSSGKLLQPVTNLTFPPQSNRTLSSTSSTSSHTGVRLRSSQTANRHLHHLRRIRTRRNLNILSIRSLITGLATKMSNISFTGKGTQTMTTSGIVAPTFLTSNISSRITGRPQKHHPGWQLAQALRTSSITEAQESIIYKSQPLGSETEEE